MTKMLRVTWKNSDWSDEELVNKYTTSGELDVLGELYNRYIHLVYGVSLKYLKNRSDAQDAVMQIFEKLVTGLRNHEIHNFKSWLYVLAKNYCLMHLRTRQTEEKRMASLKKEIEFMESQEEMHPIDRDDRTIEKALNECIAKLRKEQKECIELFYFKKYCYQEIAQTLSLEEKKVKSHIQNGKRNLKICLKKKHVR